MSATSAPLLAARWLRPLALHAVLLAGALGMLTPFIWMVTTSLKPYAQATRFPPTWLPEPVTLANYAEAWRAVPWPRFFLNSIIATAADTLLTLVICALAAYAFARLRFPGRDALFLLYLSTMMIPGWVTLIPSYLIVKWLGWLNTYQGVVVPAVGGAFGTFMLRQFFLSIPRELEEAAFVDGAGRLWVLLRVIVPLSKPALASLAILTAMGQWNAFLWPLLVTTQQQMRPVQVGLSVFQRETLQGQVPDWPLLMAATTLVVAPMVVLFVWLQRHFVQGIVMSGLKG